MCSRSAAHLSKVKSEREQSSGDSLECIMTCYFLLKHVHVGMTDDGMVFLDLRREKYFGIPASAAYCLQGLVPGWQTEMSLEDNISTPVADESVGIANELVGLGLFTQSERHGKSAIAPHLERTGAIDFHGKTGREPPIRIRDCQRFARAFIRTALSLRLQKLEAVVGSVERRKSINARLPANSNDERLRELVCIFRQLSPFFFSVKNACLFDSLTLMNFLLQYGIVPTWVIGARTRPFSAHSWVQYQGLVLNETLDRTLEFKALLVI